MLLFCTSRFYSRLKGTSHYYKHENKYIMLDLPYSMKKIKISNLLVEVADILIDMQSVWIITQQLSNLAEKSCRWLVRPI